MLVAGVRVEDPLVSELLRMELAVAVVEVDVEVGVELDVGLMIQSVLYVLSWLVLDLSV